MIKNLIIIIILISLGINVKSQNFIWAKQFGGGGTDFGRSLALDINGNIYTAGSFDSTADFDPGIGFYNLTSAGEEDIFVSKLNAAGNFVWTKQMGGREVDLAASIAVDADGNVYTTGTFQDTADFDPGPGTYNLVCSGFVNIFVSKLDASGNFLWAKGIGTGDDRSYSIAIDPNPLTGGIYTTGWFQGTVDFDPGTGTYNLTAAGSYEIFIFKLDTSGNFLWAKQMGGVSAESGSSISVDDSGNVYTTGDFYGTADFDPGPGTYSLASAGNEDIFVSKLNNAGNFIWAKQLGGVDHDHGLSIAVDANRNVYTTGNFNGIADFYPGSGVSTLISAGGAEVFVSKLDSSGNFVWAKRLGGANSDYGHSITIDGYGNVYTTGRFFGTADFDPGTGIYNLTSSGGTNIFISNLDSSGNFVWAKRMGGGTLAYSYSVAIDSNGNVYATGGFSGTADFDPGTGTYNLISAGGADIFVVKLGNTTGIEQNDSNDDLIKISPNPTSNKFTIAFPAIINKGKIEIYNVLGIEIINMLISNTHKKEIYMAQITQGVYFVKVFEGEKYYCKKLIVEND